MNGIGDEAKTVEVLLVEDNPGDARLARESFRDVNESIRLHLASDGLEAMAFLRRQGAHIRARRPDIILLDLNLPKMDGREVLAQIKGDESLKMIPTIVLSSSESDADVSISYQLGANCYLRKPAHWDAFNDLVNDINNFWLTKAKLQRQMPGQ
jgi:CheY-like chemotaxis protein